MSWPSTCFFFSPRPLHISFAPLKTFTSASTTFFITRFFRESVTLSPNSTLMLPFLSLLIVQSFLRISDSTTEFSRYPFAGHAATSMAVNMERRKRLSMKSSLRYRLFLSSVLDVHSRILASTESSLILLHNPPFLFLSLGSAYKRSRRTLLDGRVAPFRWMPASAQRAGSPNVPVAFPVEIQWRSLLFHTLVSLSGTGSAFTHCVSEKTILSNSASEFSSMVSKLPFSSTSERTYANSYAPLKINKTSMSSSDEYMLNPLFSSWHVAVPSSTSKLTVVPCSIHPFVGSGRNTKTLSKSYPSAICTVNLPLTSMVTVSVSLLLYRST